MGDRDTLQAIYDFLCSKGVHPRNNPFNKIRDINAFGRCERLNANHLVKEIARIQVEDVSSYVVTVFVEEAVLGSFVQAIVKYGAGNTQVTATYDVGDRVDIPVVGSTVRVEAKLTDLTGNGTGAAKVCASVSEGSFGNIPMGDAFIISQFPSGDLPGSALQVSGPCRLGHILAYMCTGTVNRTLMFFDQNSSTPPSNGAFPKLAFPLCANNVEANCFRLDVMLENMPVCFFNGIFWCLSSTCNTLTIDVAGSTARVDLILANSPGNSPIVANVPPLTGSKHGD